MFCKKYRIKYCNTHKIPSIPNECCWMSRVAKTLSKWLAFFAKASALFPIYSHNCEKFPERINYSIIILYFSNDSYFTLSCFIFISVQGYGKVVKCRGRNKKSNFYYIGCNKILYVLINKTKRKEKESSWMVKPSCVVGCHTGGREGGHTF